MKPSSSQAMNLTSDVKYAAMDARVSTEDQGKGFSIPTQIDACQKLAAREGYTVPDAYVLIDEGISGTTMDRPSLRKLRDLEMPEPSWPPLCMTPTASRAISGINSC